MYENPKSELSRRTVAFAEDVLECSKTLGADIQVKTVEKQRVRSATTVGANDMEATHSRSRTEFISKVSITLQETEESRYWLRLSLKHGCGKPQEGLRLEADGQGIAKMLTASIRTAKSNQQKRRA